MQENPPALVAPVLFYGRLQDVTAGSGTLAPQTIGAIDYAGKIPTVYTYNVGIQKSLPWAAVVDVSYVGSRSRNLNTQVNINAPAYGAAYLAQNQDPTVGKGCSGCAATSSIPGANALPVDFLRRYQGAGNIVQVQTSAYANYNSVQTSLNRRFSKGVSFGVN